MNGDIADKLFRPDFDRMTLDLSINNRPDVSPINSSPEKANGKHKERGEDGFNKNRIEAALGSYADFKQLRNFQRMQGISSLQSPTCTPSPTCTANKDKRKMPGSTRDPIATDSSTSSHVTTKSTDLRDKINKSRTKPCDVPRGVQVTHRALKERVEKSSEGLIEFTKLPGSKVKTEESGDERRTKQDKRKYHNSSSTERRRSSSDRKDSSETRHLSGERKRDQRRKSDHRHRDRKRPHTAGSGIDSDMESDNTLSTSDIFRLTSIFNVMRCNGAGDMSPLPHSHKQTLSSSQSRSSAPRCVRAEVESEDSDEEELDLEKLKAKLMDDSILPSSPAVKLKGKLMDEPSSSVKLKPKVIEPLVSAGDLSGSDIDSDQDCDEFPLSKSVMEIDVKREPLSDPEPRFKFDSNPSVKLEDPKPKVKVEEKPKMKPRVKLEERPVEENVKVKPERIEKEAVKACAAAAALSLPVTTETLIEVEKRDQKPFVAVNPRMKNASLCEDEGSGAMGEMLRNIRETPVTDDNLVDIRRLLASGAQFNLLLSFGYDKISTRSLNHPELISSVKSYRSKRGESESSNEEEGKPLEKPSCKVPCIPRADHVTNVTKVPAMPRAEHVARGQHEKRESVSPDRDQSPDQVYHRDKREYGYPPKRRRITREPPEYDTFQHSAYLQGLHQVPGIHTIAAIPSLAYLVQQPRNLLPPTRTQCTFASLSQQDSEKGDLDKALKGLLKFEVYYKKGHALKKEADNITHNQALKIKKYMEASIQYVYAALSAQQKQDFKSCYVWLHDTANIIDFCLRLRSNNGLDVRIQDKRLAVLCLLLVSHIQRTIWTNRRAEYLNLQRSCSHIIRQKQKELQVQNRSQSSGGNTNTSMKSGDSPTPSPAGSLMSMASYTGTEVLDTNMHHNTDTVPTRFIKDISKYFKLAQALNCWVDYWEEAGTLAQHSLGFFNYLDEQVCPISSTTHLYTVARYVGQGLENLDNYKEAS